MQSTLKCYEIKSSKTTQISFSREPAHSLALLAIDSPRAPVTFPPRQECGLLFRVHVEAEFRQHWPMITKASGVRTAG